MLKVLILDFDGVLIESNSIKDEAFARVFAAYPDRLETIMAYHRSVTAIRFEKFRHIYEHILQRLYTEQEAARCARDFSDYCIYRSINCSWVTGAQEMLQELHGRLPMYLASINPPDDLQEVLRGRRIDHYFRGVLTASGSKETILRDILAREGAAPAEALFVGDSLSDYRSSVAAGVPFIGRQAESDLSTTGARIFSGMAEVKDYVLNLMQ